MEELLYGAVGVGGTLLVLLLAKLFGGKKGKTVLAVDTEKAANAIERASELLGRRAAIEAKTEDDKKRVEEKLAIEDPVERLTAIADELKDL